MTESIEKTLSNLVTGASTAMVVFTAFAIWLIQRSLPGSEQLWPMLASSMVATLLVMSYLHADLRRHYCLLKESEDRAHRDARLDSLTCLGNRKFLMEELLVRCRNQGNLTGSLILLDLDHFKRINDTRGHQAGDDLICGVSSRLKAKLPDATIARLGGDEFALIVNATERSELTRSCELLLEIFEEPFGLAHGRKCYTSGSAGACIIQHGMSPSECLGRADRAMYTAKEDVIGFYLFDDELNEASNRRTLLTSDLAQILEEDRGLYSHMQYIMDTSGHPKGAEMLLRWKHPTLGRIPPEEIVAIAEEAQLINQCGIFISREALRVALEFPDLLISINASYVQLLDLEFAQWLREEARATGVASSQIVIEISEKELVDRGKDMSDAIKLLTDSGFKIAVDDFGTSIASLAHLSRLGATILKIDQRTIEAAREVANISIMRANILLAKTLGMSVICEAVASEEDMRIAIQAGCDLLQGYYLDKPRRVGENSQVTQVA